MQSTWPNAISFGFSPSMPCPSPLAEVQAACFDDLGWDIPTAQQPASAISRESSQTQQHQQQPWTFGPSGARASSGFEPSSGPGMSSGWPGLLLGAGNTPAQRFDAGSQGMAPFEYQQLQGPHNGARPAPLQPQGSFASMDAPAGEEDAWLKEHRASSSRVCARAAQKRFRLRSKERWGEMEDAVKAKATVLQTLVTKNEELQTRSRVLERAVAVRDQQIETLNSIAPTPGDASPGSDSSSRSQGSDIRSNSLNIMLKASMLEQAASASPPAPAALNDVACLTAKAPDAKTVKLLKTFASEDARRLWASFTHEASACLGLLGNSGPSGATTLTRLTNAVGCTAASLRHIVVLSPAVWVSLVGMDLESGAQASDALPDSHWEKVITLMALTSEQQRDTRTMYELYRLKMTSVLQERHALVAQMGRIGAGMKAPTHGPTSFTLGGLESAEVDVVDLLDANMRKEARVCALISSTFLGMLHPVQYAQAAVFSYPRFPDVLAIVALAAAPPAPSAC